MAQARRIDDLPDSPNEPRRSVPAQSGTIRIDAAEMRAARAALMESLPCPPASELEIDDDDTETSLPSLPVHEPVRDARTGADVESEEPLCAIVTPAAFSRDPSTGKRTALLMVRNQESCSALDAARRRADEAHRQHEERLHLALAIGRMVSFELSFATGAAELAGEVDEILGMRPGTHPTRLVLQHVHPDDRAAINEALFHAGRDGAPVDVDVRWIRPTDHRVIWLSARGQVDRDERGQIVALRGLLADVTARRRAEEIRARAMEIESLRLRMAEVSRVRTAFLANMSHDLRTPLNAIIGFTELIHDGNVEPGSPEQKELTGDVLAAAKRLLAFIDDLLDVAELEARTADSIGNAWKPESKR
ncbi:MAG: histidine kinase dimerization/phospho-acceptor domain-containing protein [Polyangiaceae bacterium]